jgi:hypothetical protein
MLEAGFGFGGCPMRILTLVCAVAALVAAALPFPASAYCRGCVIETPAAATSAEMLALTARAEAPPVTVKASCHFEKRKDIVNGRARWRRVEICE